MVYRSLPLLLAVVLTLQRDPPPPVQPPMVGFTPDCNLIELEFRA